MAEVRFYHLEHQTLEDVLPRMLQITLERGSRAVVQAGSDERVESLVNHLWVYEEESFLPHGSKLDGPPHLQPVYLTAADENPNAADVRFFVDGAAVGDVAGLARAVIIFDGGDDASLNQARADWKRLRAEGHEISYWQQDEQRRWVNRAGG